MNHWRGIVAAVSLIAGCTAWRTAPIPEAIRTPANEHLLHTAYAKGAQVYQCQALKDDSDKGEWAFQGTDAELFSNAALSRPIGKLTTGPTWEANDGSKVIGTIKGASPAPDPTSVRWLLYEAKSAMGNGLFGSVSSIQRVDTVGGRPPPGNCSKNQLLAIIRVPFTATFHFHAR